MAICIKDRIVNERLQIFTVRDKQAAHVNPEPLYEEEIMDKYECPCGYVYDPEVGDYEHGVDPGTAFDALPDEWVCPQCGAAKDIFTKVE